MASRGLEKPFVDVKCTIDTVLEEIRERDEESREDESEEDVGYGQANDGRYVVFGLTDAAGRLSVMLNSIEADVIKLKDGFGDMEEWFPVVQEVGGGLMRGQCVVCGEQIDVERDDRYRERLLEHVAGDLGSNSMRLRTELKEECDAIQRRPGK